MSGPQPERGRAWLSRRAGGVVLAALCAVGEGAGAATEWVVLDPALHREADPASRQRQGPWVQFRQRWRMNAGHDSSPGPLTEQMAVNCLTGAYGQTDYPVTDPKTGRTVRQRQTLGEIEHAQTFEERLVLDDNATALGRALMAFACTCPSPGSPPAPNSADLQAAYDRFIAEPLSKEELRLNYLRVRTEPIARAAIAQIAAGASFQAVFDQYASSADAVSFPHGDLGAHPETAWPIADVRRYRSLRVGQTDPVPHEGLYGWEIVQLTARRTLPAPSLDEMRPRLQQYLALARRCGWGT